jgi:hypothetical protein
MRRSQAWGLRNRWFADSSLEGSGFEPSPPPEIVTYPVMAGLVARLARPGGKLTGADTFTLELMPSQNRPDAAIASVGT